MKYAIGLDYGTKSGRAVVVELSTGEVLSAVSKEYTHGVMTEELPDGTKLQTNWALQHPRDYLEVLEETIPLAVREAGVKAGDIIGLAIDFTACTMLPISKDGTPLCFYEKYRNRPHAYVKLWKHHASQKAADRISSCLESAGEINHPRYGGKISSELLMPKILQIVEEDYEIYEEADEFLEAMDWLTMLLTGVHQRSLSSAGYKGMYLPEEGYISKELLGKMNPLLQNVVKDKLGEGVCPLDKKIGTLQSAWSVKLGLKEGIAVAPGIIDSHVGLPGCGITKPGKLMLIVGTSSVLLTLSDTPYSGKGIVGAVKGGIIPGYYALESGLAAVGDQLEWMVNNCVPREYWQEAESRGQNIHTLLCEKASALGKGGTGLLVLGWWSGNKTPYVNGELNGVIIGLNMYTKPEQIYQAFMEATAFETLSVIEIFREAGAKIDSIVACGGIAGKNSLMMQIYADVIGCEIHISASEQTAALGAAMYAAVAAGKENGGYGAIDEASKKMCRLKEEVFIPDAKAYERYQVLYQEYKKAADYFGWENSEIYSKIHM